MTQLRRSLLLALPMLLLATFAGAGELRPVSEAELRMTSVPEAPNAPAVVLFKKGTFSMFDEKTGRFSPSFTVEVRRKILTEEGKKYGEVQLIHGRHSKLQNLEGRTVLPDGREVPLPKDSVFKRRLSRSEKVFTTSIAFPAVEVGAVLDYRYRIRGASLFSLDPWHFQEEVPTLYSEVIYEFPGDVLFRAYLSDPLKTGIQQGYTKDYRTTPEGHRVWAAGRNLPAISDEPFAPPFEDLSSWYLLAPISVKIPTKTVRFLESWATVCDLFGDDYEKALKKSAAARRRAQEIASSGAPRARAEAVYRFVRDQIETEERPGVDLQDGATADSVLAARRGDSAGKALLLQSMLQASGIQARAVWAGERESGLHAMDFPNPGWFDHVLVAADLEGQRVFLDPSDRSLAFGRLAPSLEGMPALLYDRANPEIVKLPETPYTDSRRLAKVDLELDGEGRVTGKGSLTLTGHRAWDRLLWKPSAAETAEAWKKWLEESYGEYTVSDVRVQESVDEQKVEVAWSLAQREEEVLGDEAALSPSLPLGPVKQPFHAEAASRLSPILFAYADRDEVELTVRWPEGWDVDKLPKQVRHDTAAGAVLTTVEWADGARSLTYRRQFDLKQRELGKQHYPMVQALFARAEKSDAETLVLLRK
jgi:transglutaminase-like putative cysteine protease